MLLELNITNRCDDGTSDIHMVNQRDESTIYCKKINLSTSADGYILNTEHKQINLKNNDKITTSNHVVRISISEQKTAEIQYNEQRSPSQTLSDEWNILGLNENNNNICETHSALIPQNNDRHHNDDPLSFLQDNTIVNKTSYASKNELSWDTDSVSNNGEKDYLSADGTDTNVLSWAPKLEIKNPLSNPLTKQITEYPTTEYEQNILIKQVTPQPIQQTKKRTLKKIQNLLNVFS
jgi:hypothetical protein